MTDHAFVQYAGDGSTGPFAIPFPYLDRAHIVTQVDGAAASFTFVGDAAVQLDTSADVGAVVEIRRETPRDGPLVDFTDGAVLTESDLDRAILQQLYIAQETHDRLSNAVTLGADGTYDLSGRRVRALASPVEADDATTKSYVDGANAAVNLAGAQVAQAAAETARDAAATAQTRAEAARAGAETAQVAAETAQTAAEAARDQALVEVPALQSAIDAKADAVHGHAIADITGLGDALGGVGVWSYVGSLDVSSGATAEFTSLNTYDEYEIVFEDVRASVDDASLYCRFSSDNGVTFLSSSGAYQWASHWFYSGSSSHAVYQLTSDTEMTMISQGIDPGNAANEHMQGTVRMYAGQRATARTRLEARLIYDYFANGTVAQAMAVGSQQTPALTDAIQFFWSSGNFSNGTMHLFGRNYG